MSKRRIFSDVDSFPVKFQPTDELSLFFFFFFGEHQTNVTRLSICVCEREFVRNEHAFRFNFLFSYLIFVVPIA